MYNQNEVKDIIQKAKEWRKVIIAYDEALRSAAEAAVALNKVEKWKIDEVQKDFKTKAEHLNSQNLSLETAQKNLVMKIAKSEESSLRKTLLHLVLAPPDFAGLEKKAFSEETAENMQAVLFVHEIYIEHAKMISEKIIDLIEKN